MRGLSPGCSVPPPMRPRCCGKDINMFHIWKYVLLIGRIFQSSSKNLVHHLHRLECPDDMNVIHDCAAEEWYKFFFYFSNIYRGRDWQREKDSQIHRAPQRQPLGRDLCWRIECKNFQNLSKMRAESRLLRLQWQMLFLFFFSFSLKIRTRSFNLYYWWEFITACVPSDFFYIDGLKLKDLHGVH